MSKNTISKPTTNSFGHKITGTKSCFTAEIFVKDGGEVYINALEHENVDRLLNSRTVEGGTIITLLLVPSDLYKFVSYDDFDLGSNFKLKSDKVPVIKYVGINQDLRLVPVEDTKVTNFSRIVFNRTLAGTVYNKVINLLTNNRTWVNIVITEPFSFRNISSDPVAHIGSNMILYIIDFDIVDDLMVIKSSNCVHRTDAIDFVNNGIGEKQMLLRQYIKDTSCLQVAFNKEFSDEYFELLTKTLTTNVKEAKVTRKGDRYKVDVNIYLL